MLFSKKKVSKEFDISRGENDKESSEEESREERRERLKFRSVRVRRKTGEKSLLWLLLLLGLVGGLFWYLAQL
ncbi:MAG: hypothetical protein K9N46_12875 [Candidatus Marinimicrobia bacterium]|nr:hypothetical protein [Candidatus Neomarinimicrobiota bacterium]MCF7827513.1 hypothetical protein [Candidatus Neomarinimicrobiota bacterium]MCF7881625.1 hypothetical protein [Candidatus Neomarinimicrobiota bacterium]